MNHQHTSIPTSVATSNLPSTELSEYTDNTDTEGLLYTSVVKPQSLRFGDKKSSLTRPGWISRQKIIFYQCYVIDKHIAPECTLQLAQLAQVIVNYEALSHEDRERVPKTAYNMAKQFTQGSGSPETSTENKKSDTASKN